MADQENAQAAQLPTPDPALKRLDRFVGTWNAKGRTLDAEEDNVSGRLTFEWLPGGFFLQQRVELNFAGYEIHGLELIGYDPESDVFPSTVYSSVVGIPLAYEYDVKGDDVTITISHAESGRSAACTSSWSFRSQTGMIRPRRLITPRIEAWGLGMLRGSPRSG